jgi:hypothetical protein
MLDYIYSPSKVSLLAIPQLLEAMLDDGRWPRNKAEASAQQIKPLVAPQLHYSASSFVQRGRNHA